MNYNHLRYFHAVAHDGNLTRTAERLNVSQSSLSVQIRTLEDRLGHALFERRGRSLVLTEAGRIALDHADAIFRRGEELIDALSQTGRARLALRIGAVATLSRNFQIRFLEPVIGRTDIDVILRSGSPAELIAALDQLSLDVVLTSRPPERDAVSARIAHKIAEETVSLVGTPGRVGGERGLDRLVAAHPLILPGADSPLRADFDALMSRMGMRPEVAAEVDDMAMMRLLVREDVGLAVLPPIVVRDELASGRIVEAVPLGGMTEAFYAVTLDRRFPNPILNELIGARSPLS